MSYLVLVTSLIADTQCATLTALVKKGVFLHTVCRCGWFIGKYSKGHGRGETVRDMATSNGGGGRQRGRKERREKGMERGERIDQERRK